MDSVLIPALRELREDILATNKSVRELREEFEAIVTKRSRHVTALILFRQRRAKINEQLRIKGSAGATHREDDRYGGPVQAEQC